MPRDYLGKELQEFDQVVFMETGLRNFNQGTITHLSKKKATIDYVKRTEVRRTQQFFSQLIKITGYVKNNNNDNQEDFR